VPKVILKTERRKTKIQKGENRRKAKLAHPWY